MLQVGLNSRVWVAGARAIYYHIVQPSTALSERLLLPGELAKHAVSEGTKAGNEKSGRPASSLVPCSWVLVKSCDRL